ncbi:MAG TPA: hypothetical protein VGX96_16625 [Candidatus Elarobacter sp.]|nr:hypothetical protein [Candidatus Elarobacter sp.]
MKRDASSARVDRHRPRGRRIRRACDGERAERRQAHQPLLRRRAVRREAFVDDEPLGIRRQRYDALEPRTVRHHVRRVVRKVRAGAARAGERARRIRPVEHPGRIRVRVFRDAVGRRRRRLHEHVVAQTAGRVEKILEHPDRAWAQVGLSELDDARSALRDDDRGDARVPQHDVVVTVAEHVDPLGARRPGRHRFDVRRRERDARRQHDSRCDAAVDGQVAAGG